MPASGGDDAAAPDRVVDGGSAASPRGDGDGDGTAAGADPCAAAFFDLDRTLMAGSSGWYFVRAAFENGMIDRRRLAGDLLDATKFRLWGSTDAGTAKVRARIGTYLEGVHERDLRRMAPRVLSGVLPRLYPQMLAVAYAHQDAGRPIHICTAASQEMASLLSLVLSFDGGLGSRSEVLDGVYTGREGGLFTYREGKAQAIRELADRKGYDLSRSYAYSDSESDLPMLRAVGHPVAVNPDRALAAVAGDEGWEIMRFDRLHRRLKIAAAAVAAAAAGGAGRAVVR
ncbi:MAG: HAD-IB family hydrolase, partial [Solirubrobacteraceae bacterium]|nr:HAD-IB family hydrolase [Solirubrobacteraceae bacterium]